MPERSLSFDAWKDEVFQLMLGQYASFFSAESGQSMTRREIEWEKWRPWYDAGLSAGEAIEKALVKD